MFKAASIKQLLTCADPFFSKYLIGFGKLDPFIIDLDDEIFKRIHISLPNELIGNLVKRGINGIHDYLLVQSIDTLSIDMILKLDSIRSLISFSKYNINKIVEQSFVPGMIND